MCIASGDGWHDLEPLGLVKRLANCIDDESCDGEDESRLLHHVVHAPAVEAPELIPLGQDADGVRITDGLVRVRRDGDGLPGGLAHGPPAAGGEGARGPSQTCSWLGHASPVGRRC